MMDNNGKHIHRIMDSIDCNKHGKAVGQPCFDILSGGIDAPVVLSGLCGGRVLRAGYVGKPSEISTRTTRTYSKPRSDRMPKSRGPKK